MRAGPSERFYKNRARVPVILAQYLGQAQTLARPFGGRALVWRAPMVGAPSARHFRPQRQTSAGPRAAASGQRRPPPGPTHTRPAWQLFHFGARPVFYGQFMYVNRALPICFCR